MRSSSAGKEKVYEEFKPRPYQQKFLNKIAWCTSNEFLLFAKCRAGKSAMVLKHIVDTNYKVSLVCSRQKSPEGSWKDDSDKYFLQSSTSLSKILVGRTSLNTGVNVM